MRYRLARLLWNISLISRRWSERLWPPLRATYYVGTTTRSGEDLPDAYPEVNSGVGLQFTIPQEQGVIGYRVYRSRSS